MVHLSLMPLASATFLISILTIKASSLHSDETLFETSKVCNTATEVVRAHIRNPKYHGDKFYSDSQCTNFLIGTLRQLDVCLHSDESKSYKYESIDTGLHSKFEVLTTHYNDLNCVEKASVHLDDFSTECTRVNSERYQMSTLSETDENCIIGRGRLRYR